MAAKVRTKHAANSNPMVGIVMPCFNMGGYIGEALESLANQTFQDFTLVVVDDASTDQETTALLKTLQPLHGTVVFEKKNLGLSAVRNKYMAAFDTKYVFSFDPDDTLEPTFLEESVRYLEANPDKAAVAVWLKLFGAETGVTKFSEDTAKIPDMLITNNYLGSCVLRKQIFEDIGGYDTSDDFTGAEDYDFWLSALERGWSLGVIPKELFNYRKHRASASAASSRAERALIWRDRLITKHLESYQNHLKEVLLAYEKRASAAHEGYIDTYDNHQKLVADYKSLQRYTESLVTTVNDQERYIEKLKKTSPYYYAQLIKNKLRKRQT